MNKLLRTPGAGFWAALLAVAPMPAFAEDGEEKRDPIDVSVSYVVDMVGVWADGRPAEPYALDDLNVAATLDLDALAGWKGATFYADVLNNLGGVPNDRAGTLQGIDNIEVASHRLRLFEAWLEQKLGKRTSVRVGLYDLNSEFYANDSAGLLVAPAFGVGSEIAATGPNGPSIFPSTALAVRIEQGVGKSGYVRAAILNATAGTLGDPQGVNLTFDDGALLIGEAGVAGEQGKIGIGLWRYTLLQDDIYAVDPAGDPLQRRAQGIYVVAERPLGDPDAVRAVSIFARAGISDGHTTAFKGGWQAGMLVSKVLASRPDSQLSLGMNQGFVSEGYRQSLRDAGMRTTAAETAFELTYADKVAKFLTLQPDLQLVLDRAGEKGADPVVMAGLRASFEF